MRRLALGTATSTTILQMLTSEWTGTQLERNFDVQKGHPSNSQSMKTIVAIA
jgi:hypothetical protein